MPSFSLVWTKAYSEPAPGFAPWFAVGFLQPVLAWVELQTPSMPLQQLPLKMRPLLVALRLLKTTILPPLAAALLVAVALVFASWNSNSNSNCPHSIGVCSRIDAH